MDEVDAGDLVRRMAARIADLEMTVMVRDQVIDGLRRQLAAKGATGGDSENDGDACAD